MFTKYQTLSSRGWEEWRMTSFLHNLDDEFMEKRKVLSPFNLIACLKLHEYMHLLFFFPIFHHPWH
jgi:hypothetical protein